MPEAETRIRSLLTAIRPLRGAQLVQALPGGPASDSWLLHLNGEHVVLRVDQPVAGSLGLDRQAENTILESVSRAGLGPRLIWSDVDRGIQICSYIEGENWTRDSINNPDLLRQLALTLKRLHQLPPVGPAFAPAEAALRYAAEIGSPAARQLKDRTLELTAKLFRDSYHPALCHNDPVHTNIVGREPVFLIDWEYAAVGDPLFDLAVVVQHHQLTASLRAAFLHAYASEWSRAQRARLDDFILLYDHLSALWYLTMVTRFGPDSAFNDEYRRVMLRVKASGPNRGYAQSP